MRRGTSVGSSQHSERAKGKALEVTILGSSAAYPGAGQACSGFLVESNGVNLLLDCGTGVLSNLQQRSDLRGINDIVVTHMHADHFIDLVPYRYALRYGLDTTHSTRPHLHLPPGGAGVLSQVVAPFSESEAFLTEVFDVSEYAPGRPLRLAGLTLDFIPVRHYIDSYAVAIVGDKKLAYSADSGPCQGLTDVARDAEFFLCNTANCLDINREHFWGHLTPAQAGEIAKEAGAKRLVISHLWPSCNRPNCLQQAQDAFLGRAELAEDGRTYQI